MPSWKSLYDLEAGWGDMPTHHHGPPTLDNFSSDAPKTQDREILPLEQSHKVAIDQPFSRTIRQIRKEREESEERLRHHLESSLKDSPARSQDSPGPNLLEPFQNTARDYSYQDDNRTSHSNDILPTTLENSSDVFIPPDQNKDFQSRPWSFLEDTLLIELHDQGVKWEEISRRLDGRSEIACIERYQSYPSRKIHPSQKNSRHIESSFGGYPGYPTSFQSRPKLHDSSDVFAPKASVEPRYPGLLPQLDSRPISREQLVSEVKSIYAGLTMVENKTITLDKSSFIPQVWLAPTQRVRNRIKGLKGAKGFIGQSSVIALCDTGADNNFISEKIAKKLGLRIHRFFGKDSPSFVQGNGRVIHAVGSINTTWAFRADYGCPPIDIVLYVLENCIFDVMSGSRFLDHTNTMTDHQERLSPMPRPPNALGARLVNLCGTPGQRIRGCLKSEECSALPDSGADPNLLSYEFAKRRGWLEDMFEGPDDQQLLQFADGSIAKVDGRLRLSWNFVTQEFGLASRGSSTYVDFDVLRGCPHDVILGSDFLDSTDAFTDHIDSFQEVIQDGLTGLNVVVWIKSKLERKRNKTKTVQQTNQERHQQEQENELERKAQAEYEASRQRHSSSSRSRSPTSSMSSGSASSTPPDTGPSTNQPPGMVCHPASIGQSTPANSNSPTTNGSQGSSIQAGHPPSLTTTASGTLGVGTSSGPNTA